MTEEDFLLLLDILQRRLCISLCATRRAQCVLAQKAEEEGGGDFLLKINRQEKCAPSESPTRKLGVDRRCLVHLLPGAVNTH